MCAARGLAPPLHLLHMPNGDRRVAAQGTHDEENIGNRHCSPGSHRCGARATVGADSRRRPALRLSFPPAYAPPPGYAPPPAPRSPAAPQPVLRAGPDVRRAARLRRRRRPTAPPPGPLPAAQLLLPLPAAAAAPGDRSAVHARRRHRLRRAQLQGHATARPATDSAMAYTFRLGFGLRPGLLLLWDVEGAFVNNGTARAISQTANLAALQIFLTQPAVPEGGLRSRRGRPVRPPCPTGAAPRWPASATS